MTRLDGACYWLSIFSAVAVSYSTDHVVAYQRPIHCAVTALATCACLLVSASKTLPNNLFNSTRSRPSAPSYALLPRSASDHDDLPIPEDRTPAQSGRVRVTVVAIATTLLSLRIETYRRIAKATECTIPTVEIWLPLLLALYDSLRFQKNGYTEPVEKVQTTIYGSIVNGRGGQFLHSRWRYIPPVMLFCLGCHSLLKLWAGVNSTFICPIVTGEQQSVPAAQIAGLALDFLLVIILWEQLPRRDGNGLSPRRSVVLWSSVMAGTAVVWSAIGVGVYWAVHRDRYYVVLWDVPIFTMVFSIMVQALVFSVFYISTLHSVLVHGVLEMALTLIAVLVMLPSLLLTWSATNPFPPFSKALPTWTFLCVYTGWWTYRRIARVSGQSEAQVGPRRSQALFILGLALLVPAWFKHTMIHYHPIDLLIYEANLQHEAYLNLTSPRGTLAEAVGNYRNRYHRNPPPKFDVWWEFATNRSSLIIDEYDQIHNDLLPFYTISPADLRRLTWEIASNQWNEASGITIRNGTAMVQDNVIPTHRWMLEGVAALINSFAVHLPDMDLVFNINDESRVSAPYADLEEFRRQGAMAAQTGTLPFSSDRAAGWPLESTDFPDHNFRAASFQQIFRDFGSVGCDPNSAARKDAALSKSKSTLCTSCASPHSLGQFVSNWSLAGDICHQPDMAHLHGFYMSPAAFKPAYALKPVFSQSKPHGFNDILYPSAWNYMDKVKYEPSEQHGQLGEEDYRPAHPDPPFREKDNTLFWRGATSEGVSGGGGQWRGMTRQRLIHLMNNATSHPHDDTLILLPHPRYQGKWEYTKVAGDKVRDLGLSADVHVVDHIVRCGGEGMFDCTNQEDEFVPVPPSDFQAHWMYKYLFDLDGAGFSGRFLPFLQSGSLPFKSALFREWYDSRITAWRHFVPQDLRLHGVWSTLAYFAGVDGTLPSGRRIKWAGHEREAEFIAEEGRAWANKVLRKEDMEVYFFRLLLEWGRLTDDNRENLGFMMP